jgi:hypothetical protein
VFAIANLTRLVIAHYAARRQARNSGVLFLSARGTNGLFEQDVQFQADGLSERCHRLDRQILVAVFYEAEIAAVHAERFRHLMLRESGSQSRRSESLSKRLFCRFRNQSVIRGRPRHGALCGGEVGRFIDAPEPVQKSWRCITSLVAQNRARERRGFKGLCLSAVPARPDASAYDTVKPPHYERPDSQRIC